MELLVRSLEGPPPGARPVEIVERKGLGHPDTLCDAMAEEISVRLCRHYLERFGTILHHNVDKILLCGGSSRPAFGGGEMRDPLEVYLGGRATSEYRGERIPVAEIATEACRDFLRATLPALDVSRHVAIFPRIKPGSGDLTGLFARGSARVPLANDTSCGVGFAPFTDTERVVMSIERALQSPETRRDHPAIGQDVKVMAVRRGRRIALTVGCAMIGRHLADLDAYVRARETAKEIALSAAQRETAIELDVQVNVGDDVERGDVYLTVTGTSAEAGDDGQVGRGNRVSGLITPYRAMTLEAAAGKNPVSHVGKLYNLAAHAIARTVVAQIPEVADASCALVSRIGAPIDDPQIADLELRLRSDARAEEVAEGAGRIVRDELFRLPELRTKLMAGTVTVY